MSAVATEHMASLLCVLMAYDAQTGHCFVNPAWEVPEIRTEQQRGVDKALCAGQLTSRPDCMPFTQATGKAGVTHRDKFKHGGCYKHEAFAALKEVVKVDAHKSHEQAVKEV